MNVINLHNFMLKILEIKYNQTSAHRTNLPMKKNQSLTYMIDLDRQIELIDNLLILVQQHPFLFLHDITQEYLEKWRQLFGIDKPLSFSFVIDKYFKNLRYSYSKDNIYTFLNFDYRSQHFILPIEKINAGGLNE